MTLALAGGAAAAFFMPGQALANAAPREWAVPADLQPALYEALAGDVGSAYSLNDRGCAALPRQKLEACFDEKGAHFSGAASPFSLRLEAWGRADDLNPAEEAKPSIRDNRVSYEYGNVTEWWRVLPIGFEQGFTIAKRPAGEGGLIFVLAASRRDAGVAESGALTWGGLHYGRLVVTDARGRGVPATLRSGDGRISIAVDDVHAVYPLTVDPLVWLEQKVTSADGTVWDRFGESVAIDGDTALIGAPLVDVRGAGDEGAVYVFTDVGGVWTFTQKLTASDGASQNWFGFSVALDGKTALVGAELAGVGDNPGQGAAYVFSKTGDGWTQTAKLTASDGKMYGYFGSAVAVDGHTVLVGANNSNAAYLFSEKDGRWSQVAKLTPSDGGTRDMFGNAVALDGAAALVGAPNNNFRIGAAYLFTKQGDTWSETQKLTAADGAAQDRFGYSVALDGPTAIVGSFLADIGENSGQGAAYVFTKSKTGWTQTQKLVASDGGPGEGFGISVSINGSSCLVGAYNAVVDGKTGQGAAYLFSETDGHWAPVQKLVANDGEAHNNYGAAVADSGTVALVGAYLANVGDNSNQGKAYFYGRRDLGLAVSVPRTVEPGGRYVSQTIATNNSSSISPAVVVTVAIPAAASFVSANATQGRCRADAGIVTPGVVACDLGAIGGNAGSATANVTFEVKGASGSVIENTASVANSTPSFSAGATTLVNRSPVAHDGSLRVHRNQPSNGVLQASDAEGDPLTFSIVTPPAHGRVTIDDARKGLYIYAPQKGYGAADSFTFKASDGRTDSNVATIVVAMIDRPPVASDGTLTIAQNTVGEGNLQATDPDGDALVYNVVAPPGHGSLTLDSESGAYTYTPASGYYGTDSFSFKANDGQNNSNAATVNITIQGSAPPPPPPPPSDNGGGGSFGGLLLMLFAALAAMASWLRRVGRKPIVALRNFAAVVSRVAGAASTAIRPLAVDGGRRGRTAKRCDIIASSENGRTGRLLGHKRKGTIMRRQDRWAPATAGVLALALVAGVSFVPASSAAPGRAIAAQAQKPPGLTERGIEVAREAGMPSHFATMAPQSSLGLLARATKLGPHAKDDRIELTVALKLHNVAKLKSFIEQAQNPESPLYHQWLTPAKFTELYGPTWHDVDAVKSFLEGYGIRVRDVSPNRMLIHTEASAAAYELAFGVRIDDYQLDGRSFYSTEDAPVLPRTLVPLVANVLGLNRGAQLRSHLYQGRLMNAHALSPRQAPPASLTYLNPLQIAHAYNYPDITQPSNGAGVNVAILTASSSGLAGLDDPHDFWSAFGLPDHKINVIPVNGDKNDATGMGETLLDIEYSGAMGPGIVQNVYVASDASLATFVAMYNQFVNDTDPDCPPDSDCPPRNQVMTTSWGAPDVVWGNAAVTADQIFMQAAAEGISMFAAAGDKGSSDGGEQLVVADYPSSSLYITSANGTQLNIATLAGDYGSEVVWNDVNCFDQGPASTGGAISRLFDKPDWQTGPGVPTDIDMRMNSDMAATASCTKPMLVLQNGQWGVTAGTSAVAPQLAGLFAIAVAETGSALGQSNKLIYDDVSAGNQASDFHDVTQGNNGAFQAGPDWDHPTGWGSPNAGNLLSHIGIQGPKGTLKGKVSDAASGAPISGAKIVVTADDGKTYHARSGEDGTYSRMLPVGSFSITVTVFGYAGGSASVEIGDGKTVTQDFALESAPAATLKGRVIDGSGHGYGLYANIKIFTEGFGQVADVWTDPATGGYSVDLPKGTSYTLKVAAVFNGYDTASDTVALSADKTRDFSMTVMNTCTAPGYRFVNDGLGEDFNGSQFPPPGWTVTNPANNASVQWMSSGQQPEALIYGENFTGGTGDAASGNGYAGYMTRNGPFDTSLVTPPIPVTSLHGETLLLYKANYDHFRSFTDALDLDISSDNGASWTTIEHWTDSHGTERRAPGVNMRIDLAPYLPAHGSFQLRWRYYDLSQGGGIYAQIDDVVLGHCGPVPGSIVYGQVTGRISGDDPDNALVGAAVTDETGHGADTVRNPADPDLPAGSFSFFETAGDHVLSASYPHYNPDSVSLTVPDSEVVVQNFLLKSGQLSATPGSYALHVMVNNVASKKLVLENTGSGDANFTIWPINAPPPVSSRATGPFAATPRYAADKNLAAFAVDDGITRRHSTPESVPPVRHAVAHAAGDPVSNFPAGISIYGLGVDRNASNLWLGSPSYGGLGGDGMDHRFLFDGTDTGDGIDVSNSDVLFMADMAFDDRTGNIWQLSVDMPDGTTSHIVELDPVTMKPTGKNVLVPSPQSERGLAFDPLSNTWYAGDFDSEVIYHFDASGTLLDSANVGLQITGLALNPATGDLFVLTSGGEHAVYVLDTRNGYAPVTAFDIAGFDPANSGAGLDYDCNGNLWISDFANSVVWQVNSGEVGWCAHKVVPWLALSPATGTVGVGASTAVTLSIDGSGQKAFATSRTYLSLHSETAFPPRIIVPLTVTWDPQPVNLTLTGNAGPSPVRKGDTLLYTLTVGNRHEYNHGAATGVKLTYPLPQGVSYVGASGDASCTALPADGSASAPAAATGASGATISCDFGTIALGNSKTETLAVKASVAGRLTSNFEVSAREPDDGGDNRLALSSVVLGTADLALSANKASIPLSGTGTLTLTLDNAGPDPASAVQIHGKVGGDTVSLQSVSASQGQCGLSGGAVACDLGQVDAGERVTVELHLFGIAAGNATINAQASTASEEPDGANDAVAAQVTIAAPPPPDNGGGSGGGALGWLALAALLGLAMMPVLMKRRHS